MATAQVSIRADLAAVFVDPGRSLSLINSALQATSFIMKGAYQKEMPVDKGTARNSVISMPSVDRGSYTVWTTAERKGVAYPSVLVSGSGRLRGLPDFFPMGTTGEVRKGTVAYGIGGIRPNKFPERAAKKESTRKELTNFMNAVLMKQMLQTVRIES